MKTKLFSLLCLLLASSAAHAQTKSVNVWTSKSGLYSYYHIDENCHVLQKSKTSTLYVLNAEDPDFKSNLSKIGHLESCSKCHTPKFNALKNMVLMGGVHSQSANSIALGDNEIAITAINDMVSTSVLTQEGLRANLFCVSRSANQNLTDCHVTCEVVSTRKSNIGGAEGRLVIRPLYINAKDGSRVELNHDDIYLRGKNRTNVKFWTQILLFPMAFVPGTGAKAEPNREYIVTLK